MKTTQVAQIYGQFVFHWKTLCYQIWQNMVLATFCVIFLQKRLVTLVWAEAKKRKEECKKGHENNFLGMYRHSKHLQCFE
jgi:hypothetical protein